MQEGEGEGGGQWTGGGERGKGKGKDAFRDELEGTARINDGNGAWNRWPGGGQARKQDVPFHTLSLKGGVDSSEPIGTHPPTE